MRTWIKLALVFLACMAISQALLLLRRSMQASERAPIYVEPIEDMIAVRNLPSLSAHTWTFVIRNVSRQGVKLSIASKSCACTEASVAPTVVLAGGQAELTATMATPMSGTVSGSILLLAEPVGEEAPGQRVSLQFQGAILPPLGLVAAPGELHLYPAESNPEQRIDLYFRAEHTTSPSDLDVQLDPSLGLRVVSHTQPEWLPVPLDGQVPGTAWAGSLALLFSPTEAGPMRSGTLNLLMRDPAASAAVKINITE